VDRLIEQQSIEGDQDRRKQLVWAIERKLAEDAVRPIIFYSRGGTCWQPYVKGLTIGQQHLQRQPPRRRVARQIGRHNRGIAVGQLGGDRAGDGLRFRRY
jgi:hypothetical protein